MDSTVLAAPVATRRQGTPRQGPRRRRIGRVIGYVVLIVAMAAALVPFYWMVMSSLKTNNDVFTIPIKWLPDPVQWHNYVRIWQKSDMVTWLKNTLILSAAITFLQVLTGSFAAYGFAKIRFPGRDPLFVLYIATIAVPLAASPTLREISCVAAP